MRVVVTPDFKMAAGALLLVDLSGGKSRLGGSALAQCYEQLGNVVPDMDDPSLLAVAFEVTQQLIRGASLSISIVNEWTELNARIRPCQC